MNAPRYIVDPPDPLAPREEWEKFLADIQSEDQSDPSVAWATKQAKERLARDD